MQSRSLMGAFFQDESGAEEQGFPPHMPDRSRPVDGQRADIAPGRRWDGRHRSPL